MQRKKLLIVTVTLLLMLVASITATSYILLNQNSQKQFYVGVTYCGSSVQEAKKLIDQVKSYTNLFVLLSFPLRNDVAAMEEIGDYAVASGLNYAVSGGITARNINRWLNTAKERWGEQFIGVYYNDERGGDMLDGHLTLESTFTLLEGGYQRSDKITKDQGGAISISNNETITTTYYPDGTITCRTLSFDDNTRQLSTSYHIYYYPNGTNKVDEIDHKNKILTFYNSENITQCSKPIPSYEEIMKQNPIQTYDDAARAFVNANQESFGNYFLNRTQLTESILVFTVDYGLYWWDYQSGYDIVFAELAWNNTVAQEIALVRGAANLQGKSWGTCITWKYTHAPYLTDGEEMYQQMKTSYETGAQYVLIFNYSEDPENPNTLQDEHFQALERFWKNVVQNPFVRYGSIKAEVALVLPQNYGWGMRHPDDNIWGIWPADNMSQQIWSQLQDKIEQYGLKLDIVFEDPDHRVTGKYPNIYYWDQR